MRTEQDMGWWEADLEYGFFNGTIWLGDNDNLIGNPSYLEIKVNYTGQDKTLVVMSAIGFSGGIILSLVTFVFGLLTSFKKVSWVLPLTTGVVALFLVLVPLVVLYNSVPGIVDSDIQLIDPYISEKIPLGQLDSLTGNLSHGSSFTWGFLSLPLLIAAPLLMIGIKKEKAPSPQRLAYQFFIDADREKGEKMTRKEEQDVKGGSLDR